MLIQCTKKMLDKLEIPAKELKENDTHLQLPKSFLAWHANIISIGRKQAIFLINNASWYPIIIYGVVKKDFQNIEQVIQQAITEIWLAEGARQKVIDAYFEKAGQITFSKTANRSMTSRITQMSTDMHAFLNHLNKNAKPQINMSMLTSRFLQMTGKKDAIYPQEKTLELLEPFVQADENMIEMELYQLHIQLALEGHDVWRRIVIPATFTFKQLHVAIQTVFDWQNAHLHEFTAERPDEKSLHIIMDNEPELLDHINFDTSDALEETAIILKDVFPKFDEITYVYDFGDHWEHKLTFEKTTTTDIVRASYAGGAGERPPEDVGGLLGYEYYLNIIGNKQDPQHHEMKQWAEEQRERPLHEKQINSRLKGLLGQYLYRTF